MPTEVDYAENLHQGDYQFYKPQFSPVFFRLKSSLIQVDSFSTLQWSNYGLLVHVKKNLRFIVYNDDTVKMKLFFTA